MSCTTCPLVDSSLIPNPHLLPATFTPDFSELKKPVALTKPSFQPLLSEDRPTTELSTHTPPKFTAPPTPRKKTHVGKASPYKLRYQETSNGSFLFSGRLYQIQYLGQGSFSTVYTIVQNPSRLVPTVDNSDIVIKVYNGIRTEFNQSTLNGYLKSALKNYRQVMSLGLPVATIYNTETALSDLAIIQKRIDANVNPTNPVEMDQVKRFFDLSITSTVLMDLQPANLKVDNGTVVLIDFVEASDDHTIVTMIHLAIKAWIRLCTGNGWNRVQTKQFLHELSSKFENANPYFNAKWLQDLLDD
jgi:hypothetical protein